MGNHLEGRVRSCATTGLSVCLDAQRFIRLNAVSAVVSLLVGAVAAVLLALTRWQTIHLLDPIMYYRLLTLHGLNMLIFWIIFMEMAILYFAGTALLGSRLASVKTAWVSFLMMVVGAIMVDVVILMGKGDVLMTSYPPLKAHPAFYLGIILFAVGTLIGVINYFCTIYIAKRDRTYTGSVPLVVFGANAAAIIAVLTLLHGAGVYIPAFLWSLDLIQTMDPGWYRLMWWGLGHPSQQINVCAMIAVWYFLSALTTGSRPLNEAVCRTAFVLYILFINLASAHHLLVDPGVSAAWKIWNTSYAMYLAVLASMIHGFTVPASVEVAMRERGQGQGLFGWLTRAPWGDPGFSAFFLSVVIFGFVGGITGVTLGTEQINIVAHNTLRIPGHFHATVVGGTTLAFIGLCYYAVPLLFQRKWYAMPLMRTQPYLFAIGLLLLSFGMSLAGSYGVPRRHWDANFTGAKLGAGFDATAHLMLGVVGVGGVILFLAVLIFILATVATVFFGRRIADGEKMPSWQDAENTRRTEAMLAPERQIAPAFLHRTPGTMTLTLVFLATFAVYYFANWKALADVWPVR